MSSKFLKIITVLVILISIIFGFISYDKVLAATTSGYSLSFDGIDDYVDLGITESIFGYTWKTSKTVSLWLKPVGESNQCANNDAAYCDAILIMKPRYWGIGRGVIQGQDRIWVWNYDGTTEKFGVEYQQDEWIHIAMVHDGTSLLVYRNGNLVGNVASGPTSQPDSSSSFPLYLAGFWNSEEQLMYQGLIDEVRFFNLVLPQTEIQATLRSELNGDESGLVAYYKMSDGSGEILTDDSINDWNGTIKQVQPDNGIPAQWVDSTAFDIPVADDQTVNLDEDTFIAITLTGSSATNSELTYTITKEPDHQNGPFDLSNLPELVYSPEPDFNGTDTIKFTVDDGTYTSIESTVTIIVNPINDAPVGAADFYVTDQFTPLTIDAPGVLDNDEDIDSSTLTVSLLTQPQKGDLLLSEDGAFTFTPTGNNYGEDTFTYVISDGELTSDPVTVTITINQTLFEVYVPLIQK